MFVNNNSVSIKDEYGLIKYNLSLIQTILYLFLIYYYL